MYLALSRRSQLRKSGSPFGGATASKDPEPTWSILYQCWCLFCSVENQAVGLWAELSRHPKSHLDPVHSRAQRKSTEKGG